MYAKLKEKIFYNWHAPRIFRLVLAIIIIAEAVSMHNWPILAIGGIFLAMSVLNTGCCASGGNREPLKNSEEEIEFEEVK